jgi:hypothetical protein
MNPFEYLAEQCLEERANRIPAWNKEARSFKSSSDLLDTLEKSLRTKLVGRGFYSYAFRGIGGKDYVLKVLKGPNKASYDPWVPFIKEVISLRMWEKNSLFPRIDPENFIEYPDGSIAAFIEYYDPVKDFQDDILRAQQAVGVTPMYIIGAFQQAAYECDEDVDHKAYTKALAMAFRVTPEEMEEFIDFTARFRHGNIKMDVNSGNFGKRKNGQIVIFDPIGHRITGR